MTDNPLLGGVISLFGLHSFLENNSKCSPRRENMDATTFSALASVVSAACALFTLYMFREHGKGFVWTKDHKINLLVNEKGDIHIGIEIPLYNFGKGNIRFLQLNVKKINLKTKAMDNFVMDMDEAYFPEGVSIITYKGATQTFMNASEGGEGQLILIRDRIPAEMAEVKDYQEQINKQISEIPEYIVILKCIYKDGSWFGKRDKKTVIGLSVKGVQITYLSKARRQELNEYFAW
jgi:hypothetical protein